MAKNTLTVKQILYKWLQWRQKNGKTHVRNSDMAEVVMFGKRGWGQTHNASTYEREFRRAREQYSQRFEDISDRFPNRREKTWKIKEPKPVKE